MAPDSPGSLLTNTASKVSGRRVGAAGALVLGFGPAVAWVLPNRACLVNASMVGAGGSDSDAVLALGLGSSNVDGVGPLMMASAVVATE